MLSACAIRDHHPARLQMRVGQHLRKSIDGSEADIQRQQPLGPVRERLAAKQFIEIGDHRRLMRSRSLQAEVDQVRALQRIEQIADEFFFLSRQRQIAIVGGAVDPVERSTSGGSFVLGDLLPPLGDRRSQNVDAGRHHRIMHRDVDVVAEPGWRAPEQRHQHRRKTLQAR
jgi:hypothetical protein